MDDFIETEFGKHKRSFFIRQSMKYYRNYINSTKPENQKTSPVEQQYESKFSEFTQSIDEYMEKINDLPELNIEMNTKMELKDRILDILEGKPRRGLHLADVLNEKEETVLKLLEELRLLGLVKFTGGKWTVE